MHKAGLSLVFLAAAVAGAASFVAEDKAEDLPAVDDDECSDPEQSGDHCALSALQRGGGRLLRLGEAEAAGKPVKPEDDDTEETRATAQQTGLHISQLGSCMMFGCDTPYISWHTCQCNGECYRHRNCCYDYKWVCHHHHQPRPPAPLPTPPPAPTCSGSWAHNCVHTRSCCDRRMTCYEKNAGWAACMNRCSPGVHYDEPRQHQSPWSCRPIGGAPAPQPHPVPRPHPTPRPVLPSPTPAPLTCSQSYASNCMWTKRCCNPVHTCYVKNQFWAACLPACVPGIHWNDPISQRTPWMCTVLGPEPKPPAPLPTPGPTLPPGNYTWYEIHHPQHAAPSTAPLLTFYMYRTQNDQSYPPENQNLANAAGTLWYLHHEIVWHIPRRFDKTRIQRFKVQVRAPQALYDKGMNFGLRVAFDSGMCTGPFWKSSGEKSCNRDWDTYGFYVGCNYADKFPTSFKGVHYKDPIWYSLPGTCPSELWNKHTDLCEKDQPGGKCPPGVVPTGTGDCTFNYEHAGEISIDDLEGIGTSYYQFIESGGKEYDKDLDAGVNNDFWNDKYNDTACALRVEAFLQLFRDKYNDTNGTTLFPDLDDPPCDFNEWRYY